MVFSRLRRKNGLSDRWMNGLLSFTTVHSSLRLHTLPSTLIQYRYRYWIMTRGMVWLANPSP
jgi:hypothetical protein